MEIMPKELGQANTKMKIFDVKKMKKGTDDKKYEQIEGFNHKKYKVLPFKKIRDIISNEFIKKFKFLEFSEKNIKEFQKIFKLSDLEPNVNFKYLSLLEKYKNNKFKKYIKKYLYTLNYDDAKSIFKDLKTQEANEINKLNKFLKDQKINSNIKTIDSLSKIKLVNFIYQINYYFKNKKEKKDYQDLLSEYRLNTNLKYRLPNYYGNKELIFYTYLQLFIEIFSFESNETKMETDELEYNNIKDNNEENINKTNMNDDSVNEEECFSLSDWTGQENDCFEFNNLEICNDINDFFSFINENNNNEIKEEQISDKMPLNKNFKITLIYLSYLNGFDTFIEQKMLIDYDKEDFLDQIDFIYSTITYYRYNNEENKRFKFDKEFIQYSLYEPEKIRKSAIKILNYNTEDKRYLETLSKDIKESLIYTNLIQCTIPIRDAINNPFKNCSIYYKFPFNMTKNIILFDNEFFNEIKGFILKVYESKLFKEIFYLTDEFKDFLYPFEGEEKDNIFNEMFENTKFYPFEFDYLNGYTNKILPKIIISSIIKDGSTLEKIITSFTHILNTMFHEQMRHYIKTLIQYNGLRLSLSVSLESENSLKGETLDKYIKIVKKKKKLLNISKMSEDELREIKKSDGGDKMEILLYGQKLQHLFIGGAFNILDINSYNKSISEHLKEFLEQNRPGPTIELNNEILKKLPLLEKLIDFVQKYSPNRRIINEQLNGNISLQITSPVTHIPGYVFTEAKSIKAKDIFGTS